MTSPRCLTLLLLASPFAFSQGVSALSLEPMPKVTIQRGQSATVVLKAKILPGYHVNSNAPHEDYLIPLRVTFPKGGVEVESIVYPKAHDEKYSFSEKPLSVLTGNFEILLKLKAPATAAQEMGILAGKLRYQACSDKACLSPKTLEINITTDVR
jgi:hypothetical protein